MIRKLAGASAVLLVAAIVAGANASRAESPAQQHQKPQGPAAVKFAKDFPTLTDSEWKFPLGGFGGIRKGAKRHHIPVIFVHGNNVDAADWYPVRSDWRKAGWTDQEMYGLSYNGLGSQNGTATMRGNPERDAEHMAMSDSDVPRLTNNSVNVPDMYAFIKAVQSYTGSKRFSLVTHSLGVTVARETLRQHRELRKYLVAFVGIAGGNHGTSFCPPGSEQALVSCDEVAANTPFLNRLNGLLGLDETYGPAKWMTVSDGSGCGDPAFAGPDYAKSPLLKGALNRTYPLTYHNDLRISAAINADYRAFIEKAERPYLNP